MTIKNILTTVTLAAAALALSASPATAQNDGYNYGDLILGFQVTGGTGNGSYLLANLGPAATLRDAASNLTLTNVGSALSTQFGSGWYNRTDLWVGAAMAFEFDEFGTYGAGTGGLNNDPWNTVYASAARTSVGTAGTPASFAYALTPGATNQAAQGAKLAADGFETQGTGAISVIANGVILNTDWNDQNPFTSPTQQGAAFNGVFSDGVQTVLTAGIFGNLGGINAEAALDLYRIQGDNNESGTVGFGGSGAGGLDIGQSSFVGTLVIDNTGLVSFLAPIPEPSTYGLLAIGAGLAGLLHRRRVARQRRLKSGSSIAS